MVFKPHLNISNVLVEGNLEAAFGLPHILQATRAQQNVNHPHRGTRNTRFDGKLFLCSGGDEGSCPSLGTQTQRTDPAPPTFLEAG